MANTELRALVDGQYGSTGKGLAGAYVAKHGHNIDLVVTNAGPNSGHTFYHAGDKHVLKQLPTVAVARALAGSPVPVYISGGAVVNALMLEREMMKYPDVPVILNRKAALINQGDVTRELATGGLGVAGTAQGVGSAIAEKVLKSGNNTIDNWAWPEILNLKMIDSEDFNYYEYQRIFLEVSQGFSLGLHSRFYPHVTSRECTVMQGMADARIPPQLCVGTMMVVRTFPIRVGNTTDRLGAPINSGGYYSDQQEIRWEDVGVDPEMTTVTGRVRRVFTFSFDQLRDAVRANHPNIILVNFMNYIKDEHERRNFAQRVMTEALSVHRNKFIQFLWGYGPEVDDVHEEVH